MKLLQLFVQPTCPPHGFGDSFALGILIVDGLIHGQRSRIRLLQLFQRLGRASATASAAMGAIGILVKKALKDRRGIGPVVCFGVTPPQARGAACLVATTGRFRDVQEQLPRPK